MLTREELLQLEDKRRAAMVAKDIAALDRLTAPTFVYQHGTGARQDKTEFLRLIETGAYNYAGIRSENEWVFIRETVAVLVATLYLSVRTTGAPFVALRKGTIIWAKNNGVWQIEAYQGCIPADEDTRAAEAQNEPDEVKRTLMPTSVTR